MISLKQFINEQFKGRIYLDMDGVLADFDNQAKLAINNSDGKFLNNDSLMNYIRKNKETKFFRNLEVLPEGQKLFNTLKNLDIWILSSASNISFVVKEKKEWIGEHFPEIPRNQIIVVKSSKDKKKYGKKGDVLIDDFIRNTTEFTAAGGIGIFYNGFSDNTIKTLKKLKIL